MSYILLFTLLPALSLGQSTVLQPPTTIIPYTTDALKSNAPRYINTLPYYVEGLGDTSLLDNVCLSYFALTDCYDLLLIFLSYVFADGTNTVSKYLVAARSPGLLEYTSPDGNFNHTVFTTDDTTYYVYQSSADSSYVFGSTFDYGQYSPQFQCTVSKFGYGNTQYRFLPMKLPPQCVTCMTGTSNTQGCQTNNKNSRICPNNDCPSYDSPNFYYQPNNYPINNYPNNNYPNNPNNNYPANNCPTCNQPSCGCYN